MTGHVRIQNRDVGSGEWGAAESVTIVGGVITVKKSKWYKIDGHAASNDVDTINGLSEGDEVMLSMADVTHVIVLKHGTGNLDLVGNIDLTLNALKDRVRLMHDGTSLVEASSGP